MTTHELKINSACHRLCNSDQTLALYFDRDYKVGDTLILRAWDGENYTGVQITVKVRHIIFPGTCGLPETIGVMSIVPVNNLWELNTCPTTP